MIPGWSQTADEWTANAEVITSCRRVIALDTRGHGESDTPGYGYRVYRLVKDLHEVLEHLALSSVGLMGTRWVVLLYGHIWIFTVQTR